MSGENGSTLVLDNLYQPNGDVSVSVLQGNLVQVIRSACQGLDGCDPETLRTKVEPQLREGMSSQELMQVVTQAAVERTSVEEPNWQYAAARLLLRHVYEQAGYNRGLKNPGYGGFYALIERLERLGRYGRYIREQYTQEEIDELEQYIRPERDHLLLSNLNSLRKNNHQRIGGSSTLLHVIIVSAASRACLT
ncbi:MAG: hypothetical protein K6T83_17110 [Alicyclobacillus sp.]|nr:hypothetical protein [Alicyclobacillus sp.]